MLSRLARLFINRVIAAKTAWLKTVTHRREYIRPQWNPRSSPVGEDVNGVPWASIRRQLPQGWLLTFIPRLLALGDHFNFNTVPKLWRLNSRPRQRQLHLDTLSCQAWFFPMSFLNSTPRASALNSLSSQSDLFLLGISFYYTLSLTILSSWLLLMCRYSSKVSPHEK